jgi:hypothetical protein
VDVAEKHSGSYSAAPLVLDAARRGAKLEWPENERAWPDSRRRHRRDRFWSSAHNILGCAKNGVTRAEPGIGAVQEEQSWQVKKAMCTRAYRLATVAMPLFLKANSTMIWATVTFVKRDPHSMKP